MVHGVEERFLQSDKLRSVTTLIGQSQFAVLKIITEENEDNK